MSQKSLTFSQYRAGDLTIFMILTIVAEVCIGLASTKWFPEQPFSVTLVYAMTALVAMRWGPYSALIAVAGSVSYCGACGGTPRQYVIYMLGSLFSLFVLLLHRPIGKEKIRETPMLTVLYVVVTYFSIIIGRTTVSMLLGDPITVFIGMVTTDALSAVFAIVVLLICRRQNGLFEDQKHYLLRLEKAKKQESLEEQLQYQPTPEQAREAHDSNQKD